MSLTGKVLTVLCLLAALTAGVVTALAYDKNQAWRYSAFRHQLVISGLPVDVADDPELARELGEPNGETLTAVFQPVGGKPVRSLVEEVARLKEQVKGEVQAQDGEAAQQALLESYLMRLARTNDRRRTIREQVRPYEGHLEENLAVTRTEERRQALRKQAKEAKDRTRSVEELLSDNGLFGEEFQAVLAEKPDVGPAERRAAAAHLIYNLAQARQEKDPNALPRAQVVLGLTSYTAEAARQAEALRDMAQYARAAINAERSTFDADYHRALQDTQTQASVFNELTHALAVQAAKKNEWQEADNKRQLQIKSLGQQIDKARADAEAAQQAQARTERELFGKQQAVALALDQANRLERQLRQLEQGR